MAARSDGTPTDPLGPPTFHSRCIEPPGRYPSRDMNVQQIHVDEQLARALETDLNTHRVTIPPIQPATAQLSSSGAIPGALVSGAPITKVTSPVPGVNAMVLTTSPFRAQSPIASPAVRQAFTPPSEQPDGPAKPPRLTVDQPAPGIVLPVLPQIMSPISPLSTQIPPSGSQVSHPASQRANRYPPPTGPPASS